MVHQPYVGDFDIDLRNSLAGSRRQLLHLKHFTGVSDPYEAPAAPEVVVHTGEESVEESVSKILQFLEAEGLVRPEAVPG